MVTVKEVKRKICMIGDWGVGKTSLIRKFVLDQFDDKYIATFGTKVTKKRIKFKKGDDQIIDMNLMIWDIMGQKEFKKIQLNAYRGTHAALVVCDITRKDTLNNLTKWREDIVKISGEIPVIIMANKVDLKGEAEFSPNELSTVADEFQVPYFLTSAKTGLNVEAAFTELGKQLI
jgi:small GTP-binding protein